MKPMDHLRAALYRGLVNYLVSPAAASLPRQARDDVASMLQPGDVILVAGKSRFSSLVCKLTQSSWSHVAIYVGTGHHPDPAFCIVEADVEAGVRMITLGRLEHLDIHVVRATGLPEGSRRQMIDYLVSRVGRGYDLQHVVELARLLLFAPLPMGRWLSPRTIRGADPTRAVCTTLVAHALLTAGVTIGATPAVAARLQHAGGDGASHLETVLDYLVPGDFERLPEFVSVFNSRRP